MNPTSAKNLPARREWYEKMEEAYKHLSPAQLYKLEHWQKALKPGQDLPLGQGGQLSSVNSRVSPKDGHAVAPHLRGTASQLTSTTRAAVSISPLQAGDYLATMTIIAIAVYHLGSIKSLSHWQY